ncbi:MAG TPA: hypothetical protein VI193_10370 [Acidimicrobiia bacterium]
MSVESFETATASVSLEGGILVIRSTGVYSTPESVTETLAGVRSILKGVRRPLLFDARKWPGGDPEAWVTFISAAEQMFSAGAMLFDTSAPAVVGRFPEFIDRFVIPFRTFTDESEAMEFLGQEFEEEE